MKPRKVRSLLACHIRSAMDDAALELLGESLLKGQ
jgi:hypothetical protein